VDLNTFRSLLSPSGQGAIEDAQTLAPREQDFLRHFDQLRKNYPADLARSALETAILRQQAQVKFPQAASMYFTRAAFEQASSLEVSWYRTKRYQGFEHLVDLGCSIGGDTLALAQAAPVTGVDRDRLRLEMAQANAHALGLADQVSFIQADLLSPLPLASTSDTALFFDPSRRDEAGRIHTVEAYHPPLSIIQDWLKKFPALGVKLSPGVDLSELAAYEAEVEFISLNGELKEAVLWFGPLKLASRRATLLPGEHTMETEQAGWGEEAPLSQPLAFLYEPDPAILRAGLVRQLAADIKAYQLDTEIAYLTAETLNPTPFARAWEVEAWFPFSLKRLRAELRARNVGEVAVKKRGSPLQPEALIRDLRLKGDDFRWVFLTQLRGKPIVILCLQEINW
jgi:SAM-dependent methyltransferase